MNETLNTYTCNNATTAVVLSAPVLTSRDHNKMTCDYSMDSHYTSIYLWNLTFKQPNTIAIWWQWIILVQSDQTTYVTLRHWQQFNIIGWSCVHVIVNAHGCSNLVHWNNGRPPDSPALGALLWKYWQWLLGNMSTTQFSFSVEMTFAMGTSIIQWLPFHYGSSSWSSCPFSSSIFW